MAYKLLYSIGKMLNAERLIEITSAHISGINYANIGDAGLEFLKDVSKVARFSVHTTINPCGIDAGEPSKFPLPKDFIDKQLAIIRAFKKMGAKDSLTCTPYEGDNLPPAGSHVSWAESSAVIYANSVLDIKTNRESGISALASAIAGKTPLAGLHLEENRRPKFLVKVDVELKTQLHYGLLGYYVGPMTKDTIGFLSKERPDKVKLKALSAAIGASGASAMFTWSSEGKGYHASFGRKELMETLDKLNTSEDGDVIFMGCPFITLDEVRWLAGALRGRKFKKRTFLHLSRRTYEMASKEGLIDSIKRSGAIIVKDLCPSLTPLTKYMGVDKVIVDSVKAAHYLRSSFNLGISIKDITEIIKGYTDMV